MAQLMTPFNPLAYDPTQSVGQLPVGKHLVRIKSNEVKANAANTGGYIQFNLETEDGNSGAYRLNLYHENQQTVEIAHKQLSALCHVLGFFQPLMDLDVLNGIPFYVEVEQQKNDPKYTQVKKVYDANGLEPGQAGAVAPPAGFSQPAAPPAQPAAPSFAPPQTQAAPELQQQAFPQQQPTQPATAQWGQQPQQAAAPAGFAPQQTAAPVTPPWGKK